MNRLRRLIARWRAPHGGQVMEARPGELLDIIRRGELPPMSFGFTEFGPGPFGFAEFGPGPFGFAEYTADGAAIDTYRRQWLGGCRIDGVPGSFTPEWVIPAALAEELGRQFLGDLDGWSPIGMTADEPDLPASVKAPAKATPRTLPGAESAAGGYGDRDTACWQADMCMLDHACPHWHGCRRIDAEDA